jgi:hypothetical protein
MNSVDFFFLVKDVLGFMLGVATSVATYYVYKNI